MALVTMAHTANKLDGSLKPLVYDFLHKLQENDATSGLHIEPMQQSRDPRARTGRVNQQYRAVLFLLDDSGERHYLYHGTYNHDDAIRIARNTTLTMNPALALPEFQTHDEDDDAALQAAIARAREAAWQEGFAAGQVSGEAFDADAHWHNQLPGKWDVDALAEAGVDEKFAAAALTASTQAELNAVIDVAPESQGLVLLGLAQGDTLAEVRESLGLPVEAGASADDRAILDAIAAAPIGFTYVGDNPDELREALESQDIDRWRVYLHPEQRRYATGSWGGPYRLSGGAGTGKTVVLLHRARHLYRRNPNARIVLTTFTRTLSSSLAANLTRLSSGLPQVGLGEPGIAVAGIDQIAHQVLREASEAEVSAAAERLLGPAAVTGGGRVTASKATWELAVDAAEPDLPAELTHPAFLEQEYDYVILPQRVTCEREYFRATRTGRGTALNRRQRKELWKVVAQFRRLTQIDNQLTFPEACALAALVLEARADVPAGKPGADPHAPTDAGSPAHPQTNPPTHPQTNTKLSRITCSWTRRRTSRPCTGSFCAHWWPLARTICLSRKTRISAFTGTGSPCRITGLISADARAACA
ncbi:MAG: AAA family ATPase [Bowdeniella nasicola]|nr:AAA family ATPase [Bowdeniella nasicola]